jgi:hypothetical protein
LEEFVVHYHRWKAACLAGASLFFVAAAVAATGPQSHPTVAGRDLISGTVVGANGTPVSGAVVTVSLWPDETPASGVVKPVPVASETTGADGRYDLASAATQPIVAAEADNGGFANFELDTVDRSTGLSSSWFFSAGTRSPDGIRQATPNPAWRTPVSGRVPQRRVRLAPHAPGVTRPEPQMTRRMVAATTPGLFPPCIWVQTADIGTRPVAVGEVHSWTGQTDTFIYGSNADTQVQIALTGLDGQTQVGGSVHIGNSSSSGSAGGTKIRGRHANGLRVLADFDVRRYVNTCTHQTKTSVYEWDGLDVYLGPEVVSGQDGACSRSPHAHTYSPSQTFFRRHKNDAAWFTAAVDLGPISVEAQSGYSTDVQSNWTFTRRGSHTLCGNDGDPVAASRVFAGA